MPGKIRRFGYLHDGSFCRFRRDCVVLLRGCRPVGNATLVRGVAGSWPGFRGGTWRTQAESALQLTSKKSAKIRPAEQHFQNVGEVGLNARLRPSHAYLCPTPYFPGNSQTGSKSEGSATSAPIARAISTREGPSSGCFVTRLARVRAAMRKCPGPISNSPRACS